MYKGTITASTSTSADTTIPFVTVFNDGCNTDIKTPGEPLLINPSHKYEVYASLVVSGIAENTVVIMQLYSDGVAIPEAMASITSEGTANYYTLNVFDILRVKQTSQSGYANLSVQISDACTVTAGTFCVS